MLTNTSASPASATLTFFQGTTGGATQPWIPPFQEVSSTAGLVLNGGSSLFLHTLGTAAVLSQGWAQINAGAGIVGYVIFANNVPGLPEEDAPAPAVAAANDILVPYDDSTGFATGIAIVNPTGTPQDISVGFRTTSGLVATGAISAVPPMGYLAFDLATQFPVIAGHVGLAEFYSATGNLSLIALRFNPTNSSTAAPAFFQSGGPLIVPASTVPTAPTDPSNPYGY